MRLSNGRMARASWVLYRFERTKSILNHTNRVWNRDIEARKRRIFSQLRSTTTTTSTTVSGDVLSSDNSRVALIMGVANQRSIAWSCVQRFLLDHGCTTNGQGQRPWKLILTCQNDKICSKVDTMAKSLIGVDPEADNRNENPFLGIRSVDVSDPISMKTFFHEQLPEILQNDSSGSSSSSSSSSSIDAVVHSIAFAPNLKKHSLLKTTQEDFMIAHQISSYSLIDVTRNVLPYMNPCSTTSTTNSGDGDGDGGVSNNNTTTTTSSITTLSYLGSELVIPGYNVMGPAKASLESVVRQLAYELGAYHSSGGVGVGANDDGIHPTSRTVRVNAIRAGPISTISSKGGISNFQEMLRDVESRSPMRRNVTPEEVASTVYHVAAEATGLTGQTINVDGGYSIVSGPII